MSIRTYKATLKRLEAADREARNQVLLAFWYGAAVGSFAYDFDALAYARKLYIRVKRVHARLHPKQARRAWKNLQASANCRAAIHRQAAWN